MPKRGRRTQAEQEGETERTFRWLRNRHHAVESDIHCLEHHGLNRRPDKGLQGYKRYAGLGVLAYNLHKIGRRLLQRWRGASTLRLKGAFRNNKRGQQGETIAKNCARTLQ